MIETCSYQKTVRSRYDEGDYFGKYNGGMPSIFKSLDYLTRKLNTLWEDYFTPRTIYEYLKFFRRLFFYKFFPP